MAIHSKKLTSSVSGHTVKVVKHHCHLHVMKFFSVETKTYWPVKLNHWETYLMQFCQTIQKQIRNHQTTEDGLVKSITVTVTYVSKKTSEATKDELVMYIMVALRITCGRQFADAVTYHGFWVFYVYICVKMHCFCFVTNNRQSEMADHTAE